MATREADLGQAPLSAAGRLELMTQQWRMQEAAYARQFPDAARVIIEVDGRPAGRITVADRTDEIRLVQIALLPDFRGHGIGGSMLGAVLAGARRRGVPVRLHVWNDSDAMGFYQRLGFKVLRSDPLGNWLEWRAEK